MNDWPIADLHVRVKISKILDDLGGLTDDDFRNGYKHLLDVAAQNDDNTGVELLAAVIGVDDAPTLPEQITQSLSMLLTEAMGVGKEITLRKMCRLFDPHGEWIDVPKDWIGKGPGGR